MTETKYSIGDLIVRKICDMSLLYLVEDIRQDAYNNTVYDLKNIVDNYNVTSYYRLLDSNTEFFKVA